MATLGVILGKFFPSLDLSNRTKILNVNRDVSNGRKYLHSGTFVWDRKCLGQPWNIAAVTAPTTGRIVIVLPEGKGQGGVSDTSP